jgi:ATP-dependent RNA helicase DHX57
MLTFGELSDRYSNTSEAALRTMFIMNLNTINYELLAELIQHLCLNQAEPLGGSILVFLPGFAEITALYDELLGHAAVKQHRDLFWLVPLHSSLNSQDQNKVFERAPDGSIKIVLATNIAETSITIDDCVCVIDTGRMKELRYDASKHITALEDTWVSRANAMQRRGRLRLVISGYYFD